MATHSRIFAWEVPWTEEPGSYSPWGCKRVGHNLATKQQPSLWSNSRLYMTTGKTMALTIQTFVDKVMSLIFNVLSKFVIAFLPREPASFNFMVVVNIHSDFRVQENKICHCFHFFPFYLHKVMGPDAMILDF